MKRRPIGRLQTRLKRLTHPALRIIDEIGYRQVSRTDAMLVFQLMTRSHQHRTFNVNRRKCQILARR